MLIWYYSSRDGRLIDAWKPRKPELAKSLPFDRVEIDSFANAEQVQFICICYIEIKADSIARVCDVLQGVF